MLERILSYTFRVIHLPAAKNVFADWLSRYPRDGTNAPEFPRLDLPTVFPPSEQVSAIYQGEVGDLYILKLTEAASKDKKYDDQGSEGSKNCHGIT